MTVCSLTPSRMGIMTVRRVWSNRSVTGLNLAGISLGNSGYVAGGLVLSWAVARVADAIAKIETRNGTACTTGFMMGPPVLRGPRWHDRAHGVPKTSVVVCPGGTRYNRLPVSYRGESFLPREPPCPSEP